MTRIRVVSHTGATSAVLLLLAERTANESYVGSGTVLGEPNSNAANTCRSIPGSEPSPCQTIHLRSDHPRD